MAGPFVIKMATAWLDDVGFAVGSIYAVITLGSVFGTLLHGFLEGADAISVKLLHILWMKYFHIDGNLFLTQLKI